MADPGTTADHAGRTRAFAFGASSGVLARGIVLLGPLVLVPVTLAAMGTTRYGLWVAISSLPAAALFADFGLGSSLLTRLTPVAEAGDRDEGRRLVASGLAMSIAITSLLGLVLLAVVQISDPVRALVPSASEFGVASDASFVLAITATAFLLNIPLSLVYRVQMAHQMLVASNVWQAVGALTQVFVILVAIASGADFRTLVLLAAVAVPVVNLLNWLWFTGIRRRDLALWRGRPTYASSTSLLRIGLSFLALTTVSALALNLDLFLVAREAGFDESAQYSVATRLMALPAIVIAAVSTAYWPAAGAALAAGRWSWVSRATGRVSLATASAAAVAGGGVGVALPWLLPLWLPGQQASYPTVSLVLSLALWMTVQAALAPYLAVLNSLARISIQVVAFAAFLVVSVPVKVWVLGHGLLEVVPVVNVVAYAAAFIPLLLATRRLLNGPDILPDDVDPTVNERAR